MQFAARCPDIITRVIRFEGIDIVIVSIETIGMLRRMMGAGGYIVIIGILRDPNRLKSALVAAADQRISAIDARPVNRAISRIEIEQVCFPLHFAGIAGGAKTGDEIVAIVIHKNIRSPVSFRSTGI